MLECDRIDVSERIDVNKINGLRECIICDYWYLVKINFRGQPKVCDGCHGPVEKAWVLMMFKLFLLKEMIIEFIFCIWVKMKSITLLRNGDLTEATLIMYEKLIKKL